jgi:hypothetical protein
MIEQILANSDWPTASWMQFYWPGHRFFHQGILRVNRIDETDGKRFLCGGNFPGKDPFFAFATPISLGSLAVPENPG